MGSCLILRFMNMFTAELRCQRKSNRFWPNFFPHRPSRPQFWPWHRWRCLSFRHARMDGLFLGFFGKWTDWEVKQLHLVTFLCLKCGIDGHVESCLNSCWLCKAQQKQHETPNISFPPSPLKPSLLQIWPPWPDHLFWWGQPGVHSTLIVCRGKGELGSLSINGFEHHPFHFSQPICLKIMVSSYNSLYKQRNKHCIQHDFEYYTPAKQRFDLCYIASQAISQPPPGWASQLMTLRSPKQES